MGQSLSSAPRSADNSFCYLVLFVEGDSCGGEHHE